MRFPKWAPPEAITFLASYRAELPHYAENDPRRTVPDMLERLLTRDGMERAWRTLRQSNKKPFTVEVFFASAGGAYHEPFDREERMTRREYEGWRAEVQPSARSLAKLLRGTDLDFRLMVHLDLCHQGPGRLNWSRFSAILDNVSAETRRYSRRSTGARTVTGALGLAAYSTAGSS